VKESIMTIDNVTIVDEKSIRAALIQKGALKPSACVKADPRAVREHRRELYGRKVARARAIIEAAVRARA
jgi:hypothetical protein